MKMEITVPEVVEVFKQIQHEPEGLFEMIRCDVKETVGQYLSELMNVELTHFLGRERYERDLYNPLTTSSLDSSRSIASGQSYGKAFRL